MGFLNIKQDQHFQYQKTSARVTAPAHTEGFEDPEHFPHIYPLSQSTFVNEGIIMSLKPLDAQGTERESPAPEITLQMYNLKMKNFAHTSSQFSFFASFSLLLLFIYK